MDGVKQFANKQFDSSLKRLINDLHDNFKLSIKAILFLWLVMVFVIKKQLRNI